MPTLSPKISFERPLIQSTPDCLDGVRTRTRRMLGKIVFAWT